MNPASATHRPEPHNAKEALQDKLIEYKHYIREYGEDLPEVRNWNWNRKG